jgi:hypothetical protein
MAVGRMLVITLLVVTTIGAMACDGVAFTEVPGRGGGGHKEFTTLGAAHGLSLLVPVAAYANIFHAGIPVLAQP